MLENQDNIKERCIRSMYDLRVDVSSGNELVPTRSKNISLSGIYIVTDKKVPIGSDVNITLLFDPNIPRLSFNLVGEVIREDDEGIGVKFYDIDEEAFFHLYNTILYTCSDSDEFVAQCERFGNGLSAGI